jgi:DNA-binding beta-propeller fold protein YncE
MARRHVVIGALFVVALGILIVTNVVLQRSVAAQEGGGTVRAPRFEVDPLWPKPLPNHWVLGSAIGVWVDERDHVWIIHRSSATLDENEKGVELKTAECCAGAPPVLEFDAAGNLVQSWGGPGQGYEWPQSNHGIFVDHKGNVWIGGNGGGDSHILKFTRNGKFIAQYGKAGVHRGPTNAEGLSTYAGDSNDQQNFGRVAKIVVDPRDNEAYIADGYLNKRVAVLDADTGKMKRYWGAYGNKPDDRNPGPYNPDAPPPQQFRNPVHCADLSNDGLLYVCDRVNDRIQVFRKDGTFVKEGFIAKRTLASGSVWDLAFSRDPQQRYLFVVDGMNQRVHVVLRDTLEVVASFGDGGRQPGQFYGVHSIAIDSKGNLYTTETWEGKRLQKFVYRGIDTVPRRHQGVVWPRT